jgi:hypothetical protein
MKIYNIPLANKGKLIDQWYWRIDGGEYGPTPEQPHPLRRWRMTSKNRNVDPPDVTVSTYTTFQNGDSKTTVLVEQHNNWSRERLVNTVFTEQDIRKMQLESWPMEAWDGYAWIPAKPIANVQWWDGNKFRKEDVE